MRKFITRFMMPLAVAGALVSSVSATAQAQDDDRCSDEQSADGDKKRNYKTVRGPDGRKIFVIERAFVVCGKVPKPQVFYVLHQRNINYEWENLKQEFLPKITNSVKKDPF